MTRQLKANQLASAEMEAAVRWYEQRRRGLGAEFLEAVTSTISMVVEQPKIGAIVGSAGSTRRVLVPRFPFQIVYHLTPTQITIVAVAHLKRRPNYWKGRQEP